jgi:phosphoglycolate phosphatase
VSGPAALLLDLDGTLLDTAPDMGGALNLLRAEHGLEPLPAQVIRPVVSHGAMRLVALGFPEATGDTFEALRLRFLKLYAANLATGTRLFPGFEGVLEQLESRGLPWASSPTSRAGLPTRCSQRSDSTGVPPAR